MNSKVARLAKEKRARINKKQRFVTPAKPFTETVKAADMRKSLQSDGNSK